MFGVPDMAACAEGMMNSAYFKEAGMNAFVASLLSNVQEQIDRGDNEGARQALNRVKYLLGYEKAKKEG
jgi:hypothetical protein